MVKIRFTANLIMEITVTVESSEYSPSQLLARHTKLSQTVIKRAMTKGALWHTRAKQTKRLRRDKTTLQVNDSLSFYYNESVLNKSVTMPSLISEQPGYGIWYKPYGVLSQGSKWGDHCAITRLIELSTHRKVYLVHRLDRATSGLMVVAYNKTTCASLANLFANREITKRYIALVAGIYGELNQTRTLTEAIDGKAAISHITPLQYNYDQNLSRLDVHIETGRKHQIRKHLSAAGHPVIGDRLYGEADQQQEDLEDLQLCCYHLGFNCPVTGQSQTFTLAPDRLPQITTK